MTTIPTPLFIALCILAAPTVCGIFALLAVLYMIARFMWEEKQREKRDTTQMHRSIETYLRKIGGKKWTIHLARLSNGS